MKKECISFLEIIFFLEAILISPVLVANVPETGIIFGPLFAAFFTCCGFGIAIGNQKSLSHKILTRHDVSPAKALFVVMLVGIAFAVVSMVLASFLPYIYAQLIAGCLLPVAMIVRFLYEISCRKAS